MASCLETSEIADLPPIDVTAWNKVLIGLSWMRAAMFTLLGTIPLGMASVVAVANMAPWLAMVFLIVAGLLCVMTTMIFNVGLWLCCSAPLESGVRRYAQSSLVLALVGTVLPITYVILRILDRSVHLDLNWLTAVIRDERIQSFLIAGLAMNWVLTIACWFWCLAGIAAFFRQERLASRSWAVGWLFVIFASVFVILPLGEEIGTFLLFALAPYYFGAFIITPVSFFWGVGLLVDTRYVLRRVIEPLTEP